MTRFSSLPSVEWVQAHILELAPPLFSERVLLSQALGRGIPEDFQALRNLPYRDLSAMDGYALRADSLESVPARLRVVERIFAGHAPQRAIGVNECARIMTGAFLPTGADSVVIQERTKESKDGQTVEILEQPKVGQNVRLRGEDVSTGQSLMQRGTELGISEASLLWAQGISHIEVARRPSVAIISTGDELRPLGDTDPESTIDSNSPMLAAMVESAGAIAIPRGIAQDNLESLSAKLHTADNVDIVLLSAGVSVGERDFTADALHAWGVNILGNGVAIKPGKPLVWGSRGRQLIFGLPGNPISAMVTFEIFVRPVIRKMLGLIPPIPQPIRGRLRRPLKKAPGLAHFVRATVELKDGEILAEPTSTQSSGAFRSALKATHLLHFPRQASELNAGELVELFPLARHA